MKITHKLTGAVINETASEKIRDVLMDAVKKEINLRGANLRGADLGGADLSGANLIDANLIGADLGGADLSGAKGITAPIIEDLDGRILKAIEAGGKLEMGRWHTCKTTHCRAGWAIHFAGDFGKALEERIGPSAAGALIYWASCKCVPNFFASNEEALEDIKKGATK